MATTIDDDPRWYKDAVIYELHVRAFCDSNGDGVGDFPGLISRLDYLHDLGVTAIWLLPFYPSPLKDDGYDIADYFDINPAYGTLKDFKRLLQEAHARGIRVITELVVNHTSADHDWFKRSRAAAPGTRWRDFYVWSESGAAYAEARIIFTDFESSNWTRDPVSGAYYWHRFYSHQPDLNFDNPAVHEALFKVVDFWLQMGVDGMRLDAVPYLYEREGTNCENLPETHAFLAKLRRHIDERYPNRMLLAEANQWPDDAAAYFGKGDECHMNFHFPLMPRMFMAVQLEDRFPIVDILEQTPEIPDGCQWATFLRNHDELTLEMVTDEDRDYMYRMYARDQRARINLGIRRRLSPLLRSRRKVELLNGLLFSLPGTPVIYYGDEIGMGDNIYLGDRNGVRTPMQWSPDRNAGFSDANPQQLYAPVINDPEYHYETVNVEAQQSNPESLLWWMRRLIDLRRAHPVLGRGKIEFARPDNGKVLVFIRSDEHAQLLVVANLSRTAQYVEIDLSAYAGAVPVELFGRTAFPMITKEPYFLSLGQYGFYWFELQTAKAPESRQTRGRTLRIDGDLAAMMSKARARESLLAVLVPFIKSQRWFRNKGEDVVDAALEGIVPVPATRPVGYLAVVRLVYAAAEAESYFVPLAIEHPGEARTGKSDDAAVICQLVERTAAGEHPAVLIDGLHSRAFALALLEVAGRRRGQSQNGTPLTATQTGAFRGLAQHIATDSRVALLSVEQSNTSLVYGESLFLKLIRKRESGPSPEVELGRYLTDAGFAHAPRFAAAIEHGTSFEAPATAFVLQEFRAGQADGWSVTLDAMGSFFDACLSRRYEPAALPSLSSSALLELGTQSPPEEFERDAGIFRSRAALLGERTAELHLTLAREAKNPAFRPEPFTMAYQRSLYETARARLGRSLDLLATRSRRAEQTPESKELVTRVLGKRGHFNQLFKKIVVRRNDVERIRCHGDYHLGQVLFTGKDFVILDFEGEPGRTLAERRFKRCVLRDVASMIRSFDYARIVTLETHVSPRDREVARPHSVALYAYCVAAFLRSYLDALGKCRLVPADPSDLALWLDFYTVEKCLYELHYELNNRPDWVHVPLSGLLQY